MTTTGFATADFDRWPPFSKLILVLLLFVGGCAGSTAGGIKVVRIFVVFKEMIRQMALFMKPQLVIQLKLGRDRIEPGTVSNIPDPLHAARPSRALHGPRAVPARLLETLTARRSFDPRAVTPTTDPSGYR